MKRKIIRAVCFGALAIALAACSSGHTGGPAAQGGHGIYKIGSPYQIDGTWYYPSEDWNYDETGIASWYGEQFHGQYTANGEVFDLNALSAAHRTLPMPSVVRVTNLDNGRSLAIRVNDRGPFARGRIIDMSRRAAQLLGFEGNGTAKVRVQVMVPESIQVASIAGRRGTDQAPVVASQPQAAPVAAVSAQPLPPPPGVAVASNAPTPLPPGPTRKTPPAIGQPIPDPVLPEKVAVVPVKASQIYIQAGAFAQLGNATRLQTQLSRFGTVTLSNAKVSGVSMYRVRLGPIASVDQADTLLSQVIATSPEARIVVN